MDPSEYGGDDEALPRLELDQAPLARPLALDVRQQFDERARPVGAVFVEDPRPRFGDRALKVGQLSLARLARVLARRDLATDHRSCICERGVDVPTHATTEKRAKPLCRVSGLGSIPGNVGCT